MTCKHYQRQLALLSVDALDENEKTVTLEHLKVCPSCKAYWERLQTVVALYQEDADQPIAPARGPIVARARPKQQQLFTWPRTAALAMSAVVIIVGIFLFREEPPSEPDLPVASQPAAGSTLSIADSRRLLNEDLEALAEIPERYEGRDFVFSVGTRYEGP
jgi:predicted anti-sigma-YlaC factor YlaD